MVAINSLLIFPLKWGERVYFSSLCIWAVFNDVLEYGRVMLWDFCILGNKLRAWERGEEKDTQHTHWPGASCGKVINCQQA